MRYPLLCAVFLFSAGVSQAGGLLELKGNLSDSTGRPLSGAFLVDFVLSPAVEDGSAPWREGRYVRVENGAFEALLGDKAELPDSFRADGYRLTLAAPAGTGWQAALSGAPRWLGDELRAEAGPPAVPAALTRPTATVPAESPQAGSEARREEIEAYKRRIEALEKAVEKGVPLLRPQVNIYTVQRSDTLRSIAQKLYGDSDHWVDLYRANSDRIRRGGELTLGQKLLIPKISR